MHHTFHQARIVISIILAVMTMVFIYITPARADKIDTYIPTKAYDLLPKVKAEVEKFSPGFDAGYMAGHIEQESCISLTHSKCWSSKSRLKTAREEGAGLGQLTRTWRDGKIRFDTLTRLTSKYKTHLAGLTWSSVYDRPDLQIRAMVLLLMEDYNTLPKDMPNEYKLPFIASSYNQGLGGLKEDIRACSLKKGCNPNKWFSNVADIKRPGFSDMILYGRRTAWDINRHHVSNIIRHRMPKYVKYYKEH